MIGGYEATPFPPFPLDPVFAVLCVSCEFAFFSFSFLSVSLVHTRPKLLGGSCGTCDGKHGEKYHLMAED